MDAGCRWTVAGGEFLLGLIAASIAVALSGCSERVSEPRSGESIARTTSALGSTSFVPSGYACVWHDEFGGDQGLGQPRANLDESSWSFQELNVNGEAQVYTTKQCLAYTDDWNYCVEDGRLRLQGRSETVDCANNPVCAPHYGDSFHQTANYTSGRLLTKQKVHFSDGYVEFRVKLPQADRAGPPESGIWPAVWMLGENINQGPPPGSVNWPGCGEVDIMEWSSSGGKSKQGWNAIWLGPGGTNACSAWPQGGNAACGPCDPANGECIGEVTNGARYEMTGWPDFDHHRWHTYGLKWENTGNSASDQMTYYIDGVKMGVLKLGAEQGAFKADMFLTMNMALGGMLGGPIQITDWADTYMDVDYVRWYRSGQSDACGLGGGVDSGSDTASDAPTDVGPDVATDVSSDGATEVGSDAAIDVGADAVTDAGGDAVADAAPPPTVPFLPIKINFEPAGTAIPTGYLADTGDPFGVRAGGLSYGWNVSHAGYTRRRGVNADPRLDTLCHFHRGGKWDLAVPNGIYNVFISVGDPSFASSYTINVEGVSYWNAARLAKNNFLSATKPVTVSDGRLTIDEGAGGEMATRINYVEIWQ